MESKVKVVEEEHSNFQWEINKDKTEFTLLKDAKITLTLNDGKKCTPAAALWKLLTNPDATNLKAVAEEMGVSRGTFETLVKKAISIMPQYDIEYGDLMSACDRYGTAKIASYLAH